MSNFPLNRPNEGFISLDFSWPSEAQTQQKRRTKMPWVGVPLDSLCDPRLCNSFSYHETWGCALRHVTFFIVLHHELISGMKHSSFLCWWVYMVQLFFKSKMHEVAPCWVMGHRSQCVTSETLRGDVTWAMEGAGWQLATGNLLIWSIWKMYWKHFQYNWKMYMSWFSTGKLYMFWVSTLFRCHNTEIWEDDNSRWVYYKTAPNPARWGWLLPIGMAPAGCCRCFFVLF